MFKAIIAVSAVRKSHDVVDALVWAITKLNRRRVGQVL